MTVYVMLKSIGKRKPALDKAPYTVADGISTGGELIRSIVDTEVARYNDKQTDAAFVMWLSEKQVEDKLTVGKVGFDRKYSDKIADAQKAKEVAITAFEDGVFRLFIDDAEVESIDSPIALKEGSVITFIRLTFLSGSFLY